MESIQRKVDAFENLHNSFHTHVRFVAGELTRFLIIFFFAQHKSDLKTIIIIKLISKY